MIFVLDTNVLWKRERLSRLASAARRSGHEIQIPALVHAERVAQVRRERGAAFDPAFVGAFLQTHGLQVVPFDQEVAERCAEWLAQRYPSRDDWHEARRKRCEFRFQVAATESGDSCPATVDWYLAASYTADPFVFVTLDGGAEWNGTEAVSLDQAIGLAEAA